MTSVAPPTATTRSRPPDADVQDRYRRAIWPVDARYDRVFAPIAMLALVAAWLTDVTILGLSRRTFILLAIRIAQAATALPLAWAARSPQRPRWHTHARLLLFTSAPAVTILAFSLKPTRIAIQGFSMIAIWFVVGVGLHAPIRAKLWCAAATYVAYLAHLAFVMSQLGDAYARPNEIAAVLVVAALAAFWSPWLAERNETARFEEFVLRARLEGEVALRREREAALELARDEAEAAALRAVAERERAEAAARAATAEAARAEREVEARTRLIADLSHDLRTPMAGIVGLVDLLHATPLDAQQRSYLEALRRSKRSLLTLLDDIVACKDNP